MMNENLCIYIVDDEDVIHDSLSAFIRRYYENVEIVSFYTVKEFLRFLKQEEKKRNLIILDHHFDIGISGSEGVAKIRELDANIPIIFLTGVSDDSDITYKKDVNIHFKSKPISEIELKRAIQDCLEKRDKFVELQNRVIHLEHEVESLMVENKNARKWAYEALIKVGAEAGGIAGDPAEWVSFQNKILDYIETLEQNEVINFAQNGNRLNCIVSLLQNRYGQFDEKSIKFLATGEFLFENHKHVHDMDFSPMLIAYSKCFENVLANYLKAKGILEEKENVTLGDCIYKIKENLSYLKGLKDNFTKKYKKMHAFLELRNKAAHQSGVSKDDIEQAKSWLFNLKEVNKDQYLLDFIQYEL